MRHRRCRQGTGTIDHSPGEPVFLDLGTNIVAGSNPFEIHVKRKSYHDPITATQTIRPGQTRTLPAGLVQDFRGFSHFLHLTLTDAAGGKVVDRDQVFCPNDWEAVRTRPDAPPTSPYPQLCGPHPFTLGWVWGIQAGWAASTTLSDFEPLGDLPDGTYTAKVRVRRAGNRPATVSGVQRQRLERRSVAAGGRRLPPSGNLVDGCLPVLLRSTRPDILHGPRGGRPASLAGRCLVSDWIRGVVASREVRATRTSRLPIVAIKPAV